MPSVSDLPDTPCYSIKSVSIQTGIRPVTIRAWERRYQLLTPQRADNQYRLYSERDIAILRWVKSRVENGAAISSTVRELHAMLENGVWPESVILPPSTRKTSERVNPTLVSKKLFNALIHHDEPLSHDLIHQASSSLDLPSLFTLVLIPCLVDIGDAWYRGDIRVTTEHFASAFIRSHLNSINQALPMRRGGPRILIGCAPGEHHEIGSLMLSILLRNRGFRVEFLGGDLPMEDVVYYTKQEKPTMLILSATLSESAMELINTEYQVSTIRPKPFFGYGGAAFTNHPEIVSKIPGVYLGDNLIEAVEHVERLLKA